MEYSGDVWTDEDRDFVVEDGYKHDEDPTYVPDEEELSDDDKYVVTGKDFKKLTKKAKKLGAESLDYSKWKNNKYVVTLPGGKNLHFGSSKYPNFLIYKDEERKDRYLIRAKKIKNKQGQLSYKNPESANYWSVKLLWDDKNIFKK